MPSSKTDISIECPHSIKNASSSAACWRVIGNHKQKAVKVAGCLSAITFKSKKESQNPKPTDKSKKHRRACEFLRHRLLSR